MVISAGGVGAGGVRFAPIMMVFSAEADISLHRSGTIKKRLEHALASCGLVHCGFNDCKPLLNPLVHLWMRKHVEFVILDRL